MFIGGPGGGFGGGFGSGGDGYYDFKNATSGSGDCGGGGFGRPKQSNATNKENWDSIFRCIAAIGLCAIAFVITFASGSATFGGAALIVAGIG